jgi:O-antigen ligase
MAHYPAALGQYQAAGVVVDDAHNLLLNELMAGGLAGLLALLGVVISFYAATWRAWRRAAERSWQVTLAAALAAMTAWLVQAQFNPQVIVLIALFWLLVAVAAAAHRLATSP